MRRIATDLTDTHSLEPPRPDSCPGRRAEADGRWGTGGGGERELG